MKSLIKKLGFLTLFLLSLFLIFFEKVDYEYFEDKDYFKETRNNIHRSSIFHSQNKSPVKIGWSESSLVPGEPVRLTGLRFKPYKSVKDSISLQVFAFSNEEETVALISYPLWIIHPKLKLHITHAIQQQFPEITGIYFTATHTHSSIGGWASGMLGKLVVGGNHASTLHFIQKQTLNALEQAMYRLKVCRMSYNRIPTRDLVINRLNRKNGPVDSFLRVLKFENTEDRSAILATFSAHTVYLSRGENNLSGDYVAPLREFILSHEGVDQFAFAAGAMGSHSPIILNKDDSYESMVKYAKSLANYYLDSPTSKSDSIEILAFAEIPVFIPKPQFRISENWRVKPWVFRKILGKYPVNLTVLRLGDCLFIGYPIELSGEYYEGLENMAKRKGLKLIITSFNGDYLGYAPKSHYYNEVNKAETRSMNWYGPYSGDYFTRLTEEILNEF